MKLSRYHEIKNEIVSKVKLPNLKNVSANTKEMLSDGISCNINLRDVNFNKLYMILFFL